MVVNIESEQEQQKSKINKREDGVHAFERSMRNKLINGVVKEK